MNTDLQVVNHDLRYAVVRQFPAAERKVLRMASFEAAKEFVETLRAFGDNAWLIAEKGE